MRVLALTTNTKGGFKTPKDLKWVNFWEYFGAEDAGRLTPFKDDKPKDTENSPVEASSVLVVKANLQRRELL